MQCNRCGYFNAENVTVCIKCNSPLQSKNNDSQDGGRKTQALPNREQVKEMLSKTSAETNFDASKTVSDSGSRINASKTVSDFSGGNSANKTISDFGGSNQSPENEKTEIIPCPSCGYPISGEARFCPNCSHDMSDNKSKSNDYKSEERKVEMHEKPKKQRAPQKTVNIFASEKVESTTSIKLTEIKHDGENTISLSSKGKSVELNRESLDKEDNNAISSNLHAEIINFEDEWYLVNRTSAGTTFVAANKPTKISDGDIILIGNTIYKFEG